MRRINELITAHIMSIGAVDIVISFTPAAFGFSKVGGIQAPTHLPVYQEETPQEDGSNIAFSQEPADSDLYFSGAIILEIPSQDDNNVSLIQSFKHLMLKTNQKPDLLPPSSWKNTSTKRGI